MLLTAIFSTLLIVVQRSEKKRRRVSLIIMALIGTVIWRYGQYVLDRDCAHPWKPICDSLPIQQVADKLAWQTLMAALVLAVVVNILFWALIGRYNPVGSSDAIKVYGVDLDEEGG